MFGWVGKKENKFWGPDIFSPDPPKSSLQNGEKIGREKLMKIPLTLEIWNSPPSLQRVGFLSLSF